MAQTKDRKTAVQAYVEVAFDEAFAIREEYESLLERRAANRTALRGLMSQGMLSEDESAAVVELYPFKRKSVKRKSDVGDESEAA